MKIILSLIILGIIYYLFFINLDLALDKEIIFENGIKNSYLK